MAKELICPDCGTDLKLRNITKETRSGLGSYLYILCDNSECQHLAKITTGTMKGKVFDVNQKLAICKYCWITCKHRVYCSTLDMLNILYYYTAYMLN